MIHKDNPTSMAVRGNRRLAIYILGILSVLGLFLLTFSKQVGINHCRVSVGGSSGSHRPWNEALGFSSLSSPRSSSSSSPSSQVSAGPAASEGAHIVDFNDIESTGKHNKEHVLILTPLKNAAAYLPHYFDMVNTLDYPKHLISLAFLVSDSTDDTIPILKEKAEELLNPDKPDTERYNSFSIFEKDFGYELSEEARHKFEVQPLRRSFMARARNYLLTAALKDHHRWTLWLDVDVIRYSSSILKDLQSVNVDVVVPNCLLETKDNSFWGYDRNNWQETRQSLEVQKKLDPEYVIVEGYVDFTSERYMMVDMPTHEHKLTKVPLDGVGATFTLVKAEVHRQGVNFPSYPFHHQVETEGFAKMAKAMGFGVYGLPSYFIYHIDNDY